LKYSPYWDFGGEAGQFLKMVVIAFIGVSWLSEECEILEVEVRRMRML
jgi:hypothetical protein